MKETKIFYHNMYEIGSFNKLEKELNEFLVACQDVKTKILKIQYRMTGSHISVLVEVDTNE